MQHITKKKITTFQIPNYDYLFSAIVSIKNHQQGKSKMKNLKKLVQNKIKLIKLY